MARLTDLLNQINDWIEANNPGAWNNVHLDPGLSRDQIQSFCEGESFSFPKEVIELFQWRNGGNGGFFVSAHGHYDEQGFYSLSEGLGYGEDWSQEYSPDKNILALFSHEDAYWWTELPNSPQDHAPIYISDEPDFAMSSPTYPSLTAMLEKIVRGL
jgi:hypothetical protein